MRRISIIMGLSLVLIMGLALQAQAYTITVTGNAASDPNYKITSYGGADIKEDYNAKLLIPFTPPVLPSGSKSVNAVVDETATGAPIYFTEEFTFGSKDTSGNKGPYNMEWTFHVANTTPYAWTNYEFIITNLPKGVILEQASNSNALKGEYFNQSKGLLEFYATDASQFVAPDATALFNFKLQVANQIGKNQTLKVDFTQVATAGNAVPLPPSAILLGSGLLGLVGLKRFRKS